jgi:hypothetical protein
LSEMTIVGVPFTVRSGSLPDIRTAARIEATATAAAVAATSTLRESTSISVARARRAIITIMAAEWWLMVDKDKPDGACRQACLFLEFTRAFGVRTLAARRPDACFGRLRDDLWEQY